MDNKEAIYRIQTHMSIHKFYEPHAVFVSEALAKGIKALQSQEESCPVTNYQETLSGKVVPHIFCGGCQKEVYTMYSYCPYCGRRIKWK